MSDAINRLISIAAGQIGGYFPKESPYGIWYAEKVNNPIYRNGQYCAMFLSWCADKAGLLGDVIPLHAYTPSGANWFRSKGRFTKGVEGIRRGDIWYSSCAGLGRISHVGIVERVYSDGSFDTIEGNTSVTSAGSQNNGRRVARKRRNTACSLGGYGRPAYPDSPAPAPQPEPAPSQNATDYNRSVQSLLKAMGFYKGAIDGVDGPMQKEAVRYFQDLVNKYGNANLVPDGYWGPKTDAFYHWTAKAQKALNNYKGVQGQVAIDGVYGPVFNSQVKIVQKRNRLYPDGFIEQKTISFMRGQGSDIDNRP